MTRGRPRSLTREAEKYTEGPRKGESRYDVVAGQDYAAALALALMGRGFGKTEAVAVATALGIANERDTWRRLQQIENDPGGLWLCGDGAEDAMAWFILQRPDVDRIRREKGIVIPDDLLTYRTPDRPTPVRRSLPEPSDDPENYSQ